MTGEVRLAVRAASLRVGDVVPRFGTVVKVQDSGVGVWTFVTYAQRIGGARLVQHRSSTVLRRVIRQH